MESLKPAGKADRLAGISEGTGDNSGAEGSLKPFGSKEPEGVASDEAGVAADKAALTASGDKSVETVCVFAGAFMS